MDVHTGRWRAATGWDAPLPDWDGPATLVMAWGSSGLLDDPGPLPELAARFPRSVVVGCSTAGAILGDSVTDDTVTVAVSRFATTRVHLVCEQVDERDRTHDAGQRLGKQLLSLEPELDAVFVLSDGLAVNGSSLVAGLVAGTEGRVAVTGGLAGDDDRFHRTWVLVGGRPEQRWVTAVGLAGPDLEVGCGSYAGWDIFGPERRVTRSDGNVLHELDGQPALDLYKTYLGQRAEGLPGTAMLFPLALRIPGADDRQVIRTILGVDEETRSMTFAGDVPVGSLAQLMRANVDRLVQGAHLAAGACGAGDGGPTLAVAVSCVGRRLLLGRRTEDELEAVLSGLPAGADLVGFYSYGEISPVAAGGCDLHNQTMTVTTLRETACAPASAPERVPSEPSRLHRSLTRQLRGLGLSPARPPDAARWPELLRLVSGSYAEADADRYTLERSIEISSQEMRALHDVLSSRAYRDELTGLPNRPALTEHLATALTRGAHGGPTSAVLFIDLDGFKAVNDSLGHAAGDELLVRAAERITSAVRGTDVVARLGGDEFVVLCTDIDGVDAAVEVAHRIGEQLRNPFRLGTTDAGVSASIGIAMAVAGTPTGAEDVLREADIAMYHAKTTGRARCAVFGEQMRARLEARLALENALRSGARDGELLLHYQPIVAAADGRLLGLEALVRWDRPGRGLVPPEEFVTVAEETGLITAVDAWVMQEACAEAARWPGDVFVGVNLSARDLQHDELVTGVLDGLARTGLPAHRLHLELTESTLLSDDASATAHLRRLREAGVQVSIDDFGTGYSSLSYLRRLPVQTLKIDRSFVCSLPDDAVATAVVEAIVTMSRALGLTTIAEGVETVAQADRLREIGCDALQGWLFGRPVPAEELTGLLAEGRPADPER